MSNTSNEHVLNGMQTNKQNKADSKHIDSVQHDELQLQSSTVSYSIGGAKSVVEQLPLKNITNSINIMKGKNNWKFRWYKMHNWIPIDKIKFFFFSNVLFKKLT